MCENVLSFPLQPEPKFLLGRELSLLVFFLQTPLCLYLFVCFVNQFPFSSEPISHVATIVPPQSLF